MSKLPEIQVRQSSVQKLAAVREHVLNKVPVSEICSKYKCAPSVFYKWQNTLLNNGNIVFEKSSNKGDSIQIKNNDQRIAELERKLALRENAIAELVSDNIRLKKIQNGEN